MASKADQRPFRQYPKRVPNCRIPAFPQLLGPLLGPLFGRCFGRFSVAFLRFRQDFLCVRLGWNRTLIPLHYGNGHVIQKLLFIILHPYTYSDARCLFCAIFSSLLFSSFLFSSLIFCVKCLYRRVEWISERERRVRYRIFFPTGSSSA